MDHTNFIVRKVPTKGSLRHVPWSDWVYLYEDGYYWPVWRKPMAKETASMQTYGEWRQRAVNQPNLEEPSTQINSAGCRRIRSTSVEAVYCLCSDGEGYDDVTVPPSMRSFLCSVKCAAVFEFFTICWLVSCKLSEKLGHVCESFRQI